MYLLKPGLNLASISSPTCLTPQRGTTPSSPQDYPSKFVESKLLVGKCVEGVVQFMYELVCCYGAARIHISDLGGEFVNQVCVHSCVFRVNLVSYVVYAQELLIIYILCMPKNCSFLFFMYAQELFIFYFFHVHPRIAIYFLGL